MKNCILFSALIGLLTITNFTYGQSPSTYPGVTYTSLGNMEKDEDFIVVAGSCDQLLYSYDNGASWDRTFLRETARSIALIPQNPQNQFLVTYFGGMALHDLVDGEIRDFGMDSEIQDLGNFINIKIVEDQLYVFGNGAILKAKVGNYTWEQIYQDTSTNDYAYSLENTSDAIIIGTRRGKVMKLDLASDQVSTLHNLDEWITDISMGTDMVGYLDWRGGSILKTTDGWTTYEEMTDLPESINPIAFGENVVFTVNTNRIYRSMDGGATTERITTANSPMFGLTSDAYMTDDGELFLLGRNAMIAKTSDLGDSFEFLNPLIRSHFFASTMGDNGVGYVGSTDGQILKSLDYGLTWDELNLDLSSTTIYQMDILKSGKLFVAGGNEYFIIENDAIFERGNIAMNSACYSKEDNAIYGLVSTQNGESEIVKSNDEGETWSTINENIQANYTISCSQGQRIYVPLQDGAFLYSQDGGMTWEEKKYGDQTIRTMQSLGATELYIVGRDLFKTVDGGVTNEKIQSGYAIQNITMSSEDHYTATIAQNSSTTLRETTDGGISFKTIFQNCTTTASSTLMNNGSILLAQNNGHINVKKLSSPSYVFNQSEPFTGVFYPNPSDDLITTDKEWSSLKIYGLDGLLIQSYDEHTNSIDISNIPTGMIVIKATIEGEPYSQLLMIK